MSRPNEATPPGDCATISVHVGVSREDAFDVFTSEIDQWWQRGPRFRIGGRRRGTMFFEPGVGGRLFETFDVSSGTRTIEVGRVTAWEPPARVVFEWRGVNFKPEEKTLVEVGFEPTQDGTLVTVRHSGWSALPEGHPARHGLVGPAFSRMIGMWWGQLMTGFRERIVERP